VVFLAAVSGGADSMAMLSALMRMELPPESLICLHVDHGIRPAAESGGDAEFVRAFCESHRIECRIFTVPPGKIASFAKHRGIGIEAAARLFRRRALFREAGRQKKTVRILVAHTRDDMLELALMRVLRGAGPEGLSAMPAVRGRILRPLLNLSRREVLEYLAETKTPWREDASNADTAFLRNRIRRGLIPLLNEAFPSWKSGLAAMAQTQSLVAAFIGDEAERRVKWAYSKPGGSLETGSDFFSLPQIIREEALFQGIDRLLVGGKNPVPVRRAIVRKFCMGTVTASDLGPLRAMREGEKVVLSAVKKPVFERGFSLLIKEPGSYTLKKIRIEVCLFSASPGVGGFYATLPLVFRRSSGGDFLISAGKKIAFKDLVRGLPARTAIVSAVDRLGTAAFIGGGKTIAARDLSPQADQGFYSVMVKKTINETGGCGIEQS
jgi:tRNA(Ile)-lysidine synthase